ncbi:uncharacterized protein N7529_007549 [Penicillium soppii]|uniref:uncharacterized protein n=1 Tax=Penicillium soppii TaxID=69789 RepID=UPI002549B3A0|nr:uncharacterized protein N7529_007549 [Penicillium soppii]KAJ5860239.1 hypothetical protein N7529_007549 [Penicillium soppii]
MSDHQNAPDKGTSLRDTVASSNRYMPQAGKSTGKHDTTGDKPDQRLDTDQDSQHRDKVAGSSQFIPQAGKSAGKSSL